MGEKGVAQEHRGIAAITAGGGRLVAPQFRPVHDVVVYQGGQMHHFDDGGSAHELRRNLLLPAPTAEKDQRRPDAFA